MSDAVWHDASLHKPPNGRAVVVKASKSDKPFVADHDDRRQDYTWQSRMSNCDFGIGDYVFDVERWAYLPGDEPKVDTALIEQSLRSRRRDTPPDIPTLTKAQGIALGGEIKALRARVDALEIKVTHHIVQGESGR